MKYGYPCSVYRYFIVLSAMLQVFIFVTVASAAKLSIPEIAGTKGEIVKLHVSVDKIDNLAGIKLVMTYDKDMLKFMKAEKTTHTANMLYVVNDKVPGRLIIVMATTKGFAGKDAALVQMTFELLQDIKKEENVTIRISEAELMSDKLKRIEINSQ